MRTPGGHEEFGRVFFGIEPKKTGLSVPIFFAASRKKGFPLQSLAQAPGKAPFFVSYIKTV
jgi:hypothetical protein